MKEMGMQHQISVEDDRVVSCMCGWLYMVDEDETLEEVLKSANKHIEFQRKLTHG